MGYVIAFLLLAVSGYALLFEGKNAVKYLIALCIFQNIFLMICSPFLNSTTFTLLALVKEIYVCGYIVVNFVRRRTISRTGICCALAILVLLLCVMLFGQGNLKGTLTSFRQLYLPFLFVLFGESCELSQKDFTEIVRFFVICCVIACLFGLVEIATGNKIWNVLGLKRYASLKGIAERRLKNGVLRSFYSYEFGGKSMRRMASVLVDPVILGELLALALVLVMFCKDIFRSKSIKWLCTGLFAVCLLLTFAKGGILIVMISFAVLIGRTMKSKALQFLCTMGILVAAAAYLVYSTTIGSSGVAHMKGLITGFQAMMEHPFGTGIGSAGNMADAYGGYGVNNVAGDESYIGSLMAQVGWIGVAMNAWLFAHFFRKTNLAGIQSENALIVNVLNVGLLVTSFVNYTAISFTSCFLFFILYTCGLPSERETIQPRIIGEAKGVES